MGSDWDQETTNELIERQSEAIRRLVLLVKAVCTPQHISTWGESDGPVLWWKFPVCEPPYVGTPLDDDFPDYVTHWTIILVPLEGV